MARALLVVLAVVTVGVGLSYRDQIGSYLTHRKGGPAETVGWEPYPSAPQLHLAVAGDTGEPGSRLDVIGRAMDVRDADVPYDALVLLGDIVYPSGDPARLPATVFGPFAGVLDGRTELLAVVGNHDVRSDHGDALMRALGQPGRYWSRQLGDVLVVGLDSTRIDDPGQLAWLDRTLGATTARWKVVLLHHPPYSAGYQGSSDEARATFGPVFARHGVQLVLSGHDHDYQRSRPIDGVTYVVSGAGATTRRTGEEWFTAVSFSSSHFVDVAEVGSRLVVRSVDHDGRVADEVALPLRYGTPR